MVVDPSARPSGDTRPVFVYDGDCGFCTRSVTWIYARVEPRPPAVPYQRADLAGLGVTEERARHEVLWIGADGTVHGGVRAFGRLLASGRRRWWPAGAALRFPLITWLAHPVYRLVARNRYRLPGGTGACRIS
jgi:predicted DCC family thiol-disulfide oxidoreductase YuxK